MPRRGKEGELERLMAVWTPIIERIVHDPEELYDLAGKRLALITSLLGEHFKKSENTFRIAVVGNPNLGKTTLSYSLARILDLYGISSTYVDMDVYSNSGPAISGEIGWDQRIKRNANQVTQEEIQARTDQFEKTSPGIIFGDFPGRIGNLHQIEQLSKANIALILSTSIEQRKNWEEECAKAGIGYWWLISNEHVSPDPPFHPQVAGMKRRAIISPAMFATATTILLDAARMTDAPKANYQFAFMGPELLVLEELLDFHFGILTPTDWLHSE